MQIRTLVWLYQLFFCLELFEFFRLVSDLLNRVGPLELKE